MKLHGSSPHPAFTYLVPRVVFAAALLGALAASPLLGSVL